MNIGIELFTIVLELLYSWYFYTSVLGKIITSRVQTAILCLFYVAVLVGGTFLITDALLRCILLGFVSLLVLRTLYARPVLEYLYLVVLFFSLTILADLICGGLLSLTGIATRQFLSGGNARLIYNCLAKAVHLALLYLTLLLLRTWHEPEALVQALPLLLCHIICIWIGDQNFQRLIDGASPDSIIGESLGLLYVNFILCCYVEYLQRSREARQRAEREKEQLALQQDYYHQAIQNQEETRAIWHDMKKYLAAMEALVGQTDPCEAQQCLAELQVSIAHISDSVDVENPVINSILCYSMEKARQAGVQLTFDVWVDKELPIPPADLYIIIGNTVDNAVEASAALPSACRSNITLKLCQRNRMLYYEIANPYSEQTLPKQGGGHGYGLKNVRRCVERHHGSMEIQKKHGQFLLTVCLSM